MACRISSASTGGSHSPRRRRMGGLLAAVLTGAVVGGAPLARADAWRPGVNAFYSSDLPPAAVPHLAWRLSSAFTAGLADFLFETMVMKPELLPAGRVPPDQRAELDYSGVSAYQRRLYVHLSRALQREGNRLAFEVPQDAFTLRFDLLAATPRLSTCASPRCERFGFGRILPLVVPKAAQEESAAKDWILNKLYGSLNSFQINAVLQPSTGETQLMHGNRFTSLYRFELQCKHVTGCQPAS